MQQILHYLLFNTTACDFRQDYSILYIRHLKNKKNGEN